MYYWVQWDWWTAYVAARAPDYLFTLIRELISRRIETLSGDIPNEPTYPFLMSYVLCLKGEGQVPGLAIQDVLPWRRPEPD